MRQKLAEVMRMKAGQRSKYHAVPTVIDGIRFASKKEARRYGELRLLAKAGQVRSLILQPRYGLYVSPFLREGVALGELIKCGDYVGDFQYEESDRGYGGVKWTKVVEDTKGFRTDVYKLKKKWVEALYGIVIREV